MRKTPGRGQALLVVADLQGLAKKIQIKVII
jgi:hypothetical protein